MATAPDTAPEFRELAEFDRANSSRGLLLRYAHGRIRTLRFRVLIVLCGVVLTAFYANLLTALIVLIALTTLELAEYVVMMRLTQQSWQDIAKLGPVVTLISTLQAIGIGTSILVVAVQGDSARLAAWVFLLGVSLNTLLVARYHPASHRARILVYMATASAILLYQAIYQNASVVTFAVDFASFAMLLYMLANLFKHLSRREEKILLTEREAIKHSQQAQITNDSLMRSKQKLANREKEARRLALVAEHASDSIILTSRHSTVIWVNKRFTEITGYELAEAVGRPVVSLLNGPLTDPATNQKIVSARQQKIAFQGTILNHRKDGSTVWMEVRQAPVFDDHGNLKMFISVERDATAAMKKQAQLRRALDAAKLADKEKTDFLARMSHELRTPANAIVGGVELMAETPLSPDQQETLTILQQGANRMQAVVEDILIFCELSTEDTAAKREQVNLGSLIEDIASLKQAEAMAKNLTGPVVHLPMGAPCIVWSDRSHLQRIFTALIANAVKFTASGRIDITLRTTPKHNRLAIEVEVLDTGIGIAAPDQKRIFDRFTQVEGERTRKFDGAGLGLAIAQSSVHKLGGEISLCKKSLNGSRFTVSLCLQPVEITSEPASNEFLNNPDITLLVAEDNRTNRMLISKMLKGSELQLEFAEDGAQAVEKYAKLRPDLVLMDVSMPHKDGLQAAREIRLYENAEKLPTCPILALTANSFDSDRKNCFDAGMNAFLPKPVRKQMLIEALAAALGESVTQSNIIGR
ncbi:MAG: response regulator [Rhodobacteraceae bacterium]|nr:response regulator [Paracoccaceae bacterium]